LPPVDQGEGPRVHWAGSLKGIDPARGGPDHAGGQRSSGRAGSVSDRSPLRSLMLPARRITGVNQSTKQNSLASNSTWAEPSQAPDAPPPQATPRIRVPRATASRSGAGP